MTTGRPLERRQLTVMLCDLVAWTALSQRLDAEDLAEVMQAYRRRCAAAIAEHSGVVAQYVGDAILAYFGYPHAHEDDAERAIRAALAIVDPEGRGAERAAEPRVHIGIATGVVVVGELSGGDAPATADLPGPEQVSAVGSALNLAARLQALAEAGMVVVSEQTRRLAGGIFEYRDLGQHVLKGFDQPVLAWQVMRESLIRSRFQALRATALTPLVDRQPEREELRRIWSSVRAGDGRAVLLSGEPGVGKSRLAEVIAGQIADRRCLRLWYYCSPHLQSSPLAPLIRELPLAAGFTEADDGAAKLAKLARLVPESAGTPELVPLLASLLAIDYTAAYPPLNMSPQRQKQVLFQGLLHLLRTLASRRPVLLAVEDLHWIDPSSDELLGLLIEKLEGLPILAVLTARPEFQSHWDDNPRLLRMPLSPLERSDSLTMIELLCAGKPIAAPTLNQIADKTDGLPLFIEDLTRDVLEIAQLQETSGSVAPADAPLSIPATLTDSLMARLDRLGSAKAVAQTGAAIGREFSYELLAEVVGGRELKDELSRLVASGLLVRRRATMVLTYAFRHALVRDAAYASLLKKDQVSLHARIAAALLERFPDTAEAQPEILAHHFEAAKDVEGAVHYLVRAAELSAKRSGFVEAITQLQRALTLLGTQERSRSRIRRELEVCLALGGVNAEYRGFSAPECGAAYSAALDLCRELGDAPEIFPVLSGVGSYEITRANFPKCRELARECLAGAAQQACAPAYVIGYRLLGGTLFLTGEFAAARKPLEEAVALYDRDEGYWNRRVFFAQDQKSTILCYLALVLTITGHCNEGLAAAEKGLAHSRSIGDLHTINFSLCFLAAVRYIAGDAQGALQRATESLNLAREQGFATWIGISQIIRGASLVSSGDGEEGLAEIALGVKGHSGIAATAYQTYGVSLYVQGLIAAGRLDEALAGLGQALAISAKTGERFYLSELWRVKGEVLALQGKTAAAEESLAEAIAIARAQGARLFELRSTVALCRLLAGPRRQAALRERLAPVHAWFAADADVPDLRAARALLAEA